MEDKKHFEYPKGNVNAYEYDEDLKMGIVYENNKIILTNETAKSFSEKMKNPDKEVMKKRDKFLKECRENIEVIKNEDGSIVLKSKEV